MAAARFACHVYEHAVAAPTGTHVLADASRVNGNGALAVPGGEVSGTGAALGSTRAKLNTASAEVVTWVVLLPPQRRDMTAVPPTGMPAPALSKNAKNLQEQGRGTQGAHALGILLHMPAGAGRTCVAAGQKWAGRNV